MNSPNTWRATTPCSRRVPSKPSHRYGELCEGARAQNKAVKIDNLAIFSIGIINKMGAASIKEWSLAKFVEGYRLRGRATGKLSNTQLSLDANAKNAMDLPQL